MRISRIIKKTILYRSCYAILALFCLRKTQRAFHYCFFSYFFFLSPFMDGLAKDFELISHNCSYRYLWPRSGALHWTHQLIIISTSWNFFCVSTCKYMTNHGNLEKIAMTEVTPKGWHFIKFEIYSILYKMLNFVFRYTRPIF